MAGDSPESSTRETPVAPPTLVDLVHGHHESLYAYAYRLAGANDAEDLTQQVFLIAQQKLHQLRDTTNPRPWLFRILRNQFLKDRQKLKPVSEADLESDIVDYVPCEVKETHVDGEGLQKSISELPEVYRTVLLMFYFEELSYKQIAEELEIPLGTSMSRIARAKSALRRKLGTNFATTSFHKKTSS